MFSRVVFSSLLSPAHDGNASSSCSTAALSAVSIKRIVGDLRADKSLSVTRTKSDSAFTESASMPKKLRMELTNRLKKFALPSYPLAPSKNVCIASSLMPYARNSSRLPNTLAFLSSSRMYSGNCPAADNSSNRCLALSIVRCRSWVARVTAFFNDQPRSRANWPSFSFWWVAACSSSCRMVTLFVPWESPKLAPRI